MDDYRNTQYCSELDDVDVKKLDLANQIKSDHPRVRNHYDYISKNRLPYKSRFMQIYNGKCAYCGVSCDIIPRDNFEIDHIINEASFASRIEAGNITNLALACHTCNNNKRAFPITEKNYNLLSPDEDGIKTCFVREQDYYIRVSTKQRENSDVSNFYNELHFDREIHRLDFLLMSMIGLDKKLKEQGRQMIELLDAINRLRSKRNAISG